MWKETTWLYKTVRRSSKLDGKKLFLYLRGMPIFSSCNSSHEFYSTQFPLLENFMNYEFSLVSNFYLTESFIFLFSLIFYFLINLTGTKSLIYFTEASFT